MTIATLIRQIEQDIKDAEIYLQKADEEEDFNLVQYEEGYIDACRFALHKLREIAKELEQ